MAGILHFVARVAPTLVVVGALAASGCASVAQPADRAPSPGDGAVVAGPRSDGPSASADPSMLSPAPSSSAMTAPSAAPASSGAVTSSSSSASAGSAAPSGSAASAGSGAPSDAGASKGRPVKVTFADPKFEGGDVPKAKAALEKLAKTLRKCVDEHGGLESDKGKIEVQFLVRAQGIAEGVDVTDAKGVSSEAKKCVRDALKKKTIGTPSSDPVGVTVRIELEPSSSATP